MHPNYTCAAKILVSRRTKQHTGVIKPVISLQQINVTWFHVAQGTLPPVSCTNTPNTGLNHSILPLKSSLKSRNSKISTVSCEKINSVLVVKTEKNTHFDPKQFLVAASRHDSWVCSDLLISPLALHPICWCLPIPVERQSDVHFRSQIYSGSVWLYAGRMSQDSLHTGSTNFYSLCSGGLMYSSEATLHSWLSKDSWRFVIYISFP